MGESSVTGDNSHGARPSGVLSASTVARYGTGSLGTGGYTTLPGLVLVYYLTDALGIAAVAAGIILGVAKIWDVLIAPAIGALSDHSAAQRGSRRALMTVGALSLPIFFALTFAAPPGWPLGFKATWVAIAFLLSATVFSLFQVPYVALPAELTSRYHERTRLLTVRVAVLALAILLFGAGGPALRDIGGSETTGYLVMGVVTGLAMGVAMYVASQTATLGRPPAGTATSHRHALTAGYRDAGAVLRRSSALRLLLTAGALQALATGMMLAAAQYVATWVLDSQSAISALFVALIGPALVFAPVWGLVARRVGKEAGFAAALVLFAAAALGLLALWWSTGWWIYPLIGLAGVAYAGIQTLALAMVPDVISHDERTHHASSAGVIGGIWTAAETGGMALGAVGLTVILAFGGYVSSTEGSDVTQPDSALHAIVLAFSVVPALLTLAALAFMLRYPLRQKDIDDDFDARPGTAAHTGDTHA